MGGMALPSLKRVERCIPLFSWIKFMSEAITDIPTVVITRQTSNLKGYLPTKKVGKYPFK
jgi:hypothetical protein